MSASSNGVNRRETLADSADASVVTARSTYGETFAAAAARGRVSGVQFHPEKSQAVGLGILRNFIASVPVAV